MVKTTKSAKKPIKSARKSTRKTNTRKNVPRLPIAPVTIDMEEDDKMDIANSESIKEPKITVGVVRANWCGHCKALDSVWDEFKENIEGDPRLKNICNIVRIESTAPTYEDEKSKIEELMNGRELTVDGFPTIFSVRNGKLIKFGGGERTKNNLVEWVKELADPNYKEMDVAYGGKKRRSRKSRPIRKTKSWFW